MAKRNEFLELALSHTFDWWQGKNNKKVFDGGWAVAHLVKNSCCYVQKTSPRTQVRRHPVPNLQGLFAHGEVGLQLSHLSPCFPSPLNFYSIQQK